MPKYYAAIDIGAGSGAKVGLFDAARELVFEDMLPGHEYGHTPEAFADELAGMVRRALHGAKIDVEGLRAVGVATPGLLGSDGTYQLVSNLPFLMGSNLPALLSARLGVPVGIENDANAGGLAEWSVMQTELLYWVFGGGWGGAWISADGQVRYPTVDWDGRDSSLHVSNEPGYAIPLEKMELRLIFQEVGASWERFEYLLLREFEPEDGVITGPAGSPDHIRAEVILSGPGRLRLFRAIVGDDDSFVRFLELPEADEIFDSALAGKHISKLSSLRVEAAVQTDRLFGKILARATRHLLRQARHDGCPESAPICLGGKPSYALPYFGPSAQRAIGAMGLMNYLRPSVLDERGSNANLVGACVVAEQAATTR